VLLLRRVFSSISAMGFRRYRDCSAFLDELRLSAGVGPAAGTTPQAFSLPTAAILAGELHLGDARLMAAGNRLRCCDWNGEADLRSHLTANGYEAGGGFPASTSRPLGVEVDSCVLRACLPCGCSSRSIHSLPSIALAAPGLCQILT
jgi:hypothetical protein